MPTCPRCQRPPTKRHGTDRVGRQRLLCRLCGRSFTTESLSAFAGYHWPAEVILTTVRWYLAHPLSGTSVMVLLAERGIDVSQRTILRWVQGPDLRTTARGRSAHAPPPARPEVVRRRGVLLS